MRESKQALLRSIAKAEESGEATDVAALEGLLNWVDAIQDAVVDDGDAGDAGDAGEAEVFGALQEE